MKIKTSAPAEDPAIAAANKAEQARADAAFITNTQGLLNDDAKARSRRYGRRTDMTGAAPTLGGGSPAAGASMPNLGSLGGIGAGGFLSRPL